MFKQLKTKFTAFLNHEAGASSIEYALIVSLIFLAIITAVQGVRSAQTEQYSDISTAVEEAVN